MGESYAQDLDRAFRGIIALLFPRAVIELHEKIDVCFLTEGLRAENRPDINDPPPFDFDVPPGQSMTSSLEPLMIFFLYPDNIVGHPTVTPFHELQGAGGFP